MHKSYREISLGSEAIDYIQKHLKEGKTLSQYLLRSDNLKSGNIITIIPDYVSNEKAKQLEFGIHRKPPPETHKFYTDEYGRTTRAVPVTRITFWSIEKIKEFLAMGGNRCCLFEDAMASPSDPVVKKFKIKMLIFNNEIYHFLTWKDAQAEKIEQAIDESEDVYPPLLGVLTSIDAETLDWLSNENPLMQKININILETLIRNTEKIILGAYHMEGYLIWSKD
jgi:hypothetical protein